MGIGAFGGNNFKNTPCELHSNIVCPRLETTWSGLSSPYFYMPFHMPVSPGNDIEFTVEPVDANAGDTEFTLDILWSDRPYGDPINRLYARETTSSTAVGASITLSEAVQLIDFTTYLVPGGVVVADEEQTGRISATSAGFGVQNTLTQSIAVQAIEATSGSTYAEPTTKNIDIPITHSTTVITSGYAETSAPTNPGAWGYGLGYAASDVTFFS